MNNMKKYIITPGFGGIKVKMRWLGFFWITIKTFASNDPEFDVLQAEDLVEKLNEK